MTKVLVVDDEKLIVKGIRFSLEQDNMEVDCAYDGEEAMSKAKEKEYDMILLDVMLPKADGFEVLQTVREFSEVPVIMLTAKGNDMDKILGLLRNSICWSCWFAIQTKCTAVRRFLPMCGAIKLWIPAMYGRLMCMSGGCGRRSNQVQVHRSLCIPSGGSAIILLQNRQHLE